MFSQLLSVRIFSAMALLAAFADAGFGQFNFGPGASGNSADDPKVQATLLSEYDAVAPGSTTTLAVSLDIREKWHIYHPIVLDTGMATRVELDLPAGFAVGATRFPVPTFGAISGIEYLGFSGQPVLLLPLSVADDVTPGQTVTITGKVKGLVCQDDGLCIPFEREISLQLPVRAERGEAEHANLFDTARAELVPPLAEAPHLTGSYAVFSAEKLPLDESGVLYVVLDIADGWHIQANDPGVEGLIPTRVFVDQPTGFKADFDAADWPTAKAADVPGFGAVRQYAGRTVIEIPFEITDAKLETKTWTLDLLVEYQACDENGTCAMPTMAAGQVTFATVPAGAPLVANAAAERITESAATDQSSTVAGQSSTMPIAQVFFLAFLGGIILNIMPCVLPVVSLKIFGFVNQAGESRKRVLIMGLVYAGGILTSFIPLAFLLIALQAVWGGVVMQNPVALILLSGLMVALGLSMLDVFEIRLPGFAADAAGSAAGTREGYGGAFLNGVLTTILATPCTGPYLGAALGALAQFSAPTAFLGLMTVGAGLAFPYVLLSAFPDWLKLLPKPGKWMITFKHVMGLVLLAVPLWLLWVVARGYGGELIHGALIFLFAVGIAAWLWGKIGLNTSTGQSASIITTSVVLLLAGWYIGPKYFGRLGSPVDDDAVVADRGDDAAPDAATIRWHPWEDGLAEMLASNGEVVYVDYTADWCITCQANKLGVLHTAPVAERFKELGVVAIKADITRPRPDIQAEIRAHGRNGVPLNLIYRANEPDHPIVLPEVLTRQLVLEKLDEAARTRSAADASKMNTPNDSENFRTLRARAR